MRMTAPLKLSFSKYRSIVRSYNISTSVAITIPAWAMGWLISGNSELFVFIYKNKLYITENRKKAMEMLEKADKVHVTRAQLNRGRYPFFYAGKLLFKLGWRVGEELEVYHENGFLVYEPLKAAWGEAE
ncbi:hypothetical protein [Thermococcus sp. GR6]|uniref:hypothetical protein n=1 Tax=Thermococcus sp. GR6 TaxID=1638256 RepID=UPI001695A08B|nr:hypothetical protein [Thermococcus sp. GR6]NJE41850.1 hypothetical protein [Thermococcus sp. GR6]